MKSIEMNEFESDRYVPYVCITLLHFKHLIHSNLKYVHFILILYEYWYFLPFHTQKYMHLNLHTFPQNYLWAYMCIHTYVTLLYKLFIRTTNATLLLFFLCTVFIQRFFVCFSSGTLNPLRAQPKSPTLINGMES